MTDVTFQNITLINNFLKAFQIYEESYIEKVLFVWNGIINNASIIFNSTDNQALYIDYQSLSETQRALSHRSILENRATIDNFKIIKTNAQEKNREESCDFNILQLFDIGETMHSFLLANILNPYSEHGQGNLFLMNFLNKIEIKDPERGKWIVTAEKGRIDVLLKRIHPHSVVVIENKSNFAGDQNHQLYRYWHQEIYYPNRHRYVEYTGEHPEKYQIIYLTPADWKQPSTNSLTRPEGWPNNLPVTCPIIPNIWKFEKEIIEWLSLSLEGIPLNNHRLMEYIKQYIDYWK